MKFPVFLKNSEAAKIKKATPEKKFFLFSLFTVAAEMIIILLNWKKMPPEVPLYYSRPWGETQLAPVNSLFLFPLFGSGITLLNFFLSQSRRERNTLICWTLSSGSFILNVLILISIIKIIGIIL